MPEGFHVRYQGGYAGQHEIPARHLAASLTGLDRIVVRSLWAIETQIPATRSPSPETVSLNVHAPTPGCIDISLVAGAASVFMPYISSMHAAIRSKLCDHILNFTVLRWGGRPKEADTHLGKALDIIEQHSQTVAQDRIHEREAVYADRQRERENMVALLRAQAELHRGDVAKAVAPVGASCRSMTIANDVVEFEIDEATAEAAKSKEELTVSDVIEMTFRVDGIELSSKTLRVFDPDTPNRRVKVHIADPSFDPLNVSENPYDIAVRERRQIRLTGKATRKPDGTLRSFHAIGAVAI